MTNLSFLIGLMKIPSEKFLETGISKSMLSRWRTGKRRLMPGRRWAKIIAEIFLQEDEHSSSSAISDILRIWYPAEFCELEKPALLERFLTENNQLSATYQKKQRLLFYEIINDNENGKTIEQAIELGALRLIDFIELITALPNPICMECVHLQGLIPLTNDVIACFSRFFKAGHKMDTAIMTNFAYRAPSSWYVYRIFLQLHGYIHNRYFEDYAPNATDIMLATAADKYALIIKLDEPNRLETLTAVITSDKSEINNIHRRIAEYQNHSKQQTYLRMEDIHPNDIKYDMLRSDQPCYVYTGLPHFGILPTEYFTELFNLRKIEAELISESLRPLTLTPSFFNANTAVMHIFCADKIEAVLMKKRHKIPELSKILKRPVYMNTKQLLRQLTEIQSLLGNIKIMRCAF
ncbi:MAG: hypothetical protein LBT88_08305 [Oscillospiraceae bacterium]|jgi:hypothetical protein|nr:hypothetical protein [Oscillospiraceae bacterium]